MSAVYCRHCGTRITDDSWRDRGFCNDTCRASHEAEPEPLDVSPGAFMELDDDSDGAS